MPATTDHLRVMREYLDKTPADHSFREQMAYMLKDQGDWRAAGLLYMALRRKYPSNDQGEWQWWDEEFDRLSQYRRRPRKLFHDSLPQKIFRALAGFTAGGDAEQFKVYPSREKAEEALCFSLSELDSK